MAGKPQKLSSLMTPRRRNQIDKALGLGTFPSSCFLAYCVSGSRVVVVDRVETRKQPN